MATKIECDRCGKICQPDEVNIGYHVSKQLFDHIHIEFDDRWCKDLCPECSSSFQKWWKEGLTTNK